MSSTTARRRVVRPTKLRLYYRRGDAENRIKDAQLGLFATRTSYQYTNTDQFRILLSALAAATFTCNGL